MNDASPTTGISEFLTHIRHRPGLYFGEKSLSGLYFFLTGFAMGSGKFEVPDEFHNWTAYRCGFSESTAGWRNMILETVPDEERAFDRFFELLDQYNERVPRVVARLEKFLTHQSIVDPASLADLGSCVPHFIEQSFTESFSFISYTEDAGLFVRSDSPRWSQMPAFGLDLDWLLFRIGAKFEDLTILDPARFARVVQPGLGIDPLIPRRRMFHP